MLNITTAKTTAPLISTNFQKTMVQFNNSSFDTNIAGLWEQKGLESLTPGACSVTKGLENWQCIKTSINFSTFVHSHPTKPPNGLIYKWSHSMLYSWTGPW